VFELIALVVFVVVPWLIGYGSASWWTLLLPAASLVAAVVTYLVHPPGHTDEVDVEYGLWILGSIVAVVACVVAIVVRRRRRARARPA
jgi:O-antigen/teichoic acid export membrane protein